MVFVRSDFHMFRPFIGFPLYMLSKALYILLLVCLKSSAAKIPRINDFQMEYFGSTLFQRPWHMHTI